MSTVKKMDVLVSQIKEDLDEYVGCKVFSKSQCPGGSHLKGLELEYETKILKLFKELKELEMS